MSKSSDPFESIWLNKAAKKFLAGRDLESPDILLLNYDRNLRYNIVNKSRSVAFFCIIIISILISAQVFLCQYYKKKWTHLHKARCFLDLVLAEIGRLATVKEIVML